MMRVPIGMTVGLGIALVMACDDGHTEDDSQFHEDVIWCEEAAAHLQECCGTAFDPKQIACVHYFEQDTGCGDTTTQTQDPAFTTDESRCLRGQSCDQIRAADICARAMAAGRARTSESSSNPDGTFSSSTSSGSVGTAAVCP